LIELLIKYSFKGKFYSEDYIFDNYTDVELFAKEAINNFLSKNYKHLSIEFIRKEKYKDLKIDTDTVKKKLEGAKKDRYKRIEETGW
jgi:hypothetical protein